MGQRGSPQSKGSKIMEMEGSLQLKNEKTAIKYALEGNSSGISDFLRCGISRNLVCRRRSRGCGNSIEYDEKHFSLIKVCNLFAKCI
jgi:hypothetical protein